MPSGFMRARMGAAALAILLTPDLEGGLPIGVLILSVPAQGTSGIIEKGSRGDGGSLRARPSATISLSGPRGKY